MSINNYEKGFDNHPKLENQRADLLSHLCIYIMALFLQLYFEKKITANFLAKKQKLLND